MGLSRPCKRWVLAAKSVYFLLWQHGRLFAVGKTAGIAVQGCGDCHLMNFGAFATPEGGR